MRPQVLRVLACPMVRLCGLEQEELPADYLPHTQAVRVAQPPPLVPDCRDPLDAPFMQLAVAGKARLLVSGDRDLLALAAVFEKTCVNFEMAAPGARFKPARHCAQSGLFCYAAIFLEGTSPCNARLHRILIRSF